MTKVILGLLFFGSLGFWYWFFNYRYEPPVALPPTCAVQFVGSELEELLAQNMPEEVVLRMMGSNSKSAQCFNHSNFPTMVLAMRAVVENANFLLKNIEKIGPGRLSQDEFVNSFEVPGAPDLFDSAEKFEAMMREEQRSSAPQIHQAKREILDLRSELESIWTQLQGWH